MKIIFSKLFYFIGVFILLVNVQTQIYACQNIYPTMCQSYTGAKSVFIGKLVNFDEKDLIITAQFETEETFKGKTEKLQTVEFSNGSCHKIDLVVGEKYLVFDDPKNVGPGYIHSINLLNKSDYALKYIKSLSQSNPTFTISGIIKNLSDEELSNTILVIENEIIKQKIAIGKDGDFKFIAGKEGNYRVNLNLPFEAEVFANELNSVFAFTGNKIKYSFPFVPNGCSYQEIEIHKKAVK